MSSAQKKRIAVVSGGYSHEANFSSAPWIMPALSALGHDVVSLDYSDPAFLPRLLESHVDVVFPQTLGAYGEDGVFQGILEFLGISYVGSGVTASALCANKWMCSKYLKSVASDSRSLSWSSPLSCLIPQSCPHEFAFLAEEIGCPFVLKPTLGGASFGVELIHTKAQYEAALNRHMPEFECLVAEEFIKGNEFCWGFIEGPDGRVALPVELVRDNGGQSILAQSDKILGLDSAPNRSVDPYVANAFESIGQSISTAIGIRGFARIDIIVDEHDQPFVLEINTLPGLIPGISKFPLMCEKAGIGYGEMLNILVSSSAIALPMHMRKLAHPPATPVELTRTPPQTSASMETR